MRLDLASQLKSISAPKPECTSSPEVASKVEAAIRAATETQRAFLREETRHRRSFDEVIRSFYLEAGTDEKKQAQLRERCLGHDTKAAQYSLWAKAAWVDALARARTACNAPEGAFESLQIHQRLEILKFIDRCESLKDRG